MGDLPMYFWNQLHDDITQLSEAIGRSIDEVALLFHSVLREINQKGEGIQILQSSDLTITLYFYHNHIYRSNQV